jgi:hypothetical protein
MAILVGGVDQRRQLVPTSLLHDHVQRSRMVRIPTSANITFADIYYRQSAPRMQYEPAAELAEARKRWNLC